MFQMVAVCGVFLMSALMGAPSAQAASGQSWNGKIVEVHTHRELSLDQLGRELADAATPIQQLQVVLGEKHYTPAVQQAQAQVIESVVQARGAQDRFTTGWEFLNYSDQTKIAPAFARFVSGEIDAMDFLRQIVGREMEAPYVPILETTKRLGGALMGVNLTREQKAPVVKGGINAADPSVVPPGFEMGGQAYFDRFVEAMGGHGDPRQLENYFAAQCLTDDAIAYRLTGFSNHLLRFLVIGSFHSDFRDGVVARIQARAPRQKTLTVRFIDASDFEEAEIDGFVHDAKYGEIADYVFFVNEPKASN